MISIDTTKNTNIDSFKDITGINYQCQGEANFTEKAITSIDKNSIVIPIKENETIVLNSMIEINEEDTCSIFTETISKAKPLQVY